MIRQHGARPRHLLTLAGLLLLLLITTVQPAFAASFVVSKTADTNDGACNADCSLREAITAANAAATNDVITFAAGANGTISLASALPVLASNGTLTIAGNNPTNTIVNGNQAGRVFQVASGATVTISGMKIAGGLADHADGGGILNNGSLTVTSCTISGNLAVSGGNGGGISNNGTLTVTSSTLSGNYAVAGGSGGAVWNVGTLTLANSKISDNHADRGGGIGTAALSVSTVTSSTLSGNEGSLGGGGIRSAGTLNLNNSIVASSTGGDCENGGGTINAQHSLIGGGLSCVNGTNSANLTGDPALNSDLTLSGFSPAINAGSNALIPAGITTDLAGNARIQFSTVDMGAYESAFGGPSPTPTQPAPTPTPALVQTLVVTKTTDSDDGSCDANDCSLREAITRANTLSTDDTITFKSSANGTITLDSALPDLANKGALTITGNGRTNTIVNGIVSGGNTVRVFRVASGATVKIANMTITKGDGGIENYGGTLTVTSSSISGNSTVHGGGIVNVSVLNHNATLTVTNSTISGNSAQGQGGGISTSINSVTTVNNSTISGNSAAFGGGIDNIGTLNLNNSIVANSIGGGDCDNDTQVGAIVNARNSLIEEGLGCVNGTNSANLKRDPALNADLTPSKFSEAINAGDNALIPAGITTDLAGNARIQSATVDIGAYESSFSGPMQQTFLVTKTADTDDGSCDAADCSLREAITAANAAAGDNPISFAPSANGTITLGSELPVLASGDTLTITGNGAASTVISGGNNVGVFKVASDGTVKISGVTITQGKREGSGGGIWNDGTLTVTSSRLSGNSATGSGAGGGGISNAGTLAVTNSTISGNSSGSRGGGISTNAGSTTTVTNSTISGNSATGDGGISNAGALTLNNTIVAGNSDSTFATGDDDCDSFDYAGATVSAQNSLVEDGSSCGVVGGTNGNLTGQAALNGDLTLSQFSPAINAGNNALIPAGITTDLAGNARVQFTTVDMGAFESAFNGSVQETFVVTKTADTNDGSCDAADCSLREAITAANASILDDLITFAPGANGTITLASALPALAKKGTLTITGNGAANTIVSGNNAVRVFGVGNDATVTISRMTIANGRADFAAGIFNGVHATLTVTSSIFSGNTARSANAAAPDGSGGAISNGTGSTLKLTNDAFSGNSAQYGGGILNDGALTATNCTFSGNSAVTDGSGIYVAMNGTLNLRNSIVANGVVTGIVGGTTGVDCGMQAGATINAQNSLIEDTLGCVNGVSSNNLTGEPALEDDLTLSIVSPAINAGSNAVLPGGTTTDLAGNPRIQFTKVDMGAYESPYSVIAPPTPTPSARFVVTKTADTNDGSCDVADCSLREAITAVNANGSGLTKAITFASSANGTITLSSALPGLGTNNGALVITGNGRTNTIVSGNHAVRVFNVDGNAPVTISRMTIANGSADQGGGIRNDGGTLTVANAAFSGNSATGINGNAASAGGGGIFSFFGTLTLTNTAFTGNSASFGGALLSNNGTATVTNSTLNGNPGGGITLLTSILGGTLNLNNSIVDSCDNQDKTHGTVNAQNSLIVGGLGCVNGTNTANLTGDPALNGDLTLSSFSRAINAGNNALVPAGTILDLAGNARVQFTTVDMGAFESAFGGVATPTPTPTKTPTPTPSATPTKTPTPTPSSTPTKTPTPTPSKTPKPTASPVPSATPQRVADDYDGDGIADVAVYETATGNWLVITSTSGPGAQAGFGGPGFSPVPGSYSGSVYTELGIYDVATGTFISSRGDETATSVDPFVPDEWLPAQADYDGDGETDVAVYNKITGEWSYRRSSDDVIATSTLGGTGFLAIPADFDGDGKADVAVYQVSNGSWTYIASSTGAQVSLGTFGGGTRFVPVPADYDGDGKADQALYQKKKGKWRFKLSTTGTTSNFTGIGGTGWLATPGDFDGDGKVDAGAYRKSTGGWRYRSSLTGLKTTLPILGGPGFVPVVGLRP